MIINFCTNYLQQRFRGIRNGQYGGVMSMMIEKYLVFYSVNVIGSFSVNSRPRQKECKAQILPHY